MDRCEIRGLSRHASSPAFFLESMTLLNIRLHVVHDGACAPSLHWLRPKKNVVGRGLIRPAAAAEQTSRAPRRGGAWPASILERRRIRPWQGGERCDGVGDTIARDTPAALVMLHVHDKLLQRRELDPAASTPRRGCGASSAVDRTMGSFRPSGRSKSVAGAQRSSESVNLRLRFGGRLCSFFRRGKRLVIGRDTCAGRWHTW